MYWLSIETGFDLPDGSIDSIDLTFEKYEDAVRYAQIPVEQGYTVVIEMNNKKDNG